MRFKYAAEMDGIAGCPPAGATGYGDPAYRFVHGDPTDPRNFLCARKLSPSRVLPSSEACGAWGLPFFVTSEAATRRYEDLRSTMRNIGKTLGTKLAVVPLTQADGVASKPNRKGHFDLWEAEGVDFATRFEVVLDLAT